MKAAKILLMILLLLPVAHSLGATKTSYSASINPGESVGFKIVLFSQNSVDVELIPEIPDDWNIIIDPNQLILPPETETKEYVALDKEYIMALPVYVNISVPNNTQPRDYETKITAQTIPGQGIGVVQEINFLFKITVLGDAPETVETTTSIENSHKEDIIIIDLQFILVIIAVIIILVGVGIYLRI